MTRWSPVPEWENLYEVSDDGLVRSVARTTIRRNGTRQTWRGRLLRQFVNAGGYPAVHLRDESRGRSKTARVHRLVAQAFLENPEDKPEVNHKDGNKMNPRIENLEWVTARENRKHAWDAGLRTREHLPVKWGEQNPLAKLTDAQVAHMRELHSSGVAGCIVLGRMFGVNKSTVQDIVRWRSRKLPPPPTDADNEEDAPHVCPGCHAFGEDPCLPGCIDAEIAERRERDRDDYGTYEDESRVRFGSFQDSERKDESDAR